jgi:hypothetical protein
MLRLMLDHHPEIGCHYEFEYAVEQVTDTGQFPNLTEYRQFLRHNRIFKLTDFKIDEALPYRELVESFLVQKQNYDAKPVVGATIHYNFDRLRFLWPNARYIYLARDGRDVAYSCMRQGWAGNLYSAVEFWTKAEASLKQLRKLVADEQILEVRFENLVSDPEATLSTMCSFLGVDYSPAMFDYSEFSTYGPPDVTAANRWKDFDARDLALAESRIGPMLLARGYELSGAQLVKLGAWQRQMLWLDNHWQNFKARAKRFGFGLTVAEMITRRAHLKTLAKRFGERMDDVINQQLI